MVLDVGYWVCGLVHVAEDACVNTERRHYGRYGEGGEIEAECMSKKEHWNGVTVCDKKNGRTEYGEDDWWKRLARHHLWVPIPET
jgi:hypothetical protein